MESLGAAAAFSSSPLSPPAVSTPSDEPPRVKFLCSFGGSILPRPVDGKLRYVGGETRIVSVPRDVSYEELMGRLRELFDGAWALKYQQPEEDLDALISVVNDDDVTNMMEEYDKLGALGDGFTRLRIFLFSRTDNESAVLSASAAGSAHYDSVDERETERRYVDALNSLSDGKAQSNGDVQVIGGVTMNDNRSHVGGDQFLSHRGMDTSMIHDQFNLRRLIIPRQPSVAQHYNEIDGSWSPVYYSPGAVLHDREFPPSPSSRRYHPVLEELNDRIPDEYVRHEYSHQHQQHELSPSFVESLVWLPPGGVIGEKAGFPGNLGHVHNNNYDSSTVCEHCLNALQRNQAALPDTQFHDLRWKHRSPPFEHLTLEGQNSQCNECIRTRETYFSNPNIQFDQHIYAKDQIERCSHYSEFQGNDRGRVLHHHHANQHLDEPRVQCNEQYVLDRNSVNLPFAHSNFPEQNPVPSNYLNIGSPNYGCFFMDPGTEMYQDQQGTRPGVCMRMQKLEADEIQYNGTHVYGADAFPQMASGSPPNSHRREVHGASASGLSNGVPVPELLLYEPLSVDLIEQTKDGSPGYPFSGLDDQVPVCSLSNKIFPIDDQAANPVITKESQKFLDPEIVQHQLGLVDLGSSVEPGEQSSSPLCVDKAAVTPRSCHPFQNGDDLMTTVVGENNFTVRSSNTNQMVALGKVDECNMFSRKKISREFIQEDSKPIVTVENFNHGCPSAHGPSEHQEPQAERQDFLSEFISSVKVPVLEDAKDIKLKTHDNTDVNPILGVAKTDSSLHDATPVTVSADVDADGDTEEQDISKIEPTTAEAEALAKGLQTIKNSDLEEVRELGSGTYGSVYHGKWKGSDVAIKRIKASCFAGRPSERERLIADFWKEALTLSSLHHPNVVSFYGVVRDGPDGSLATVTEFMVNGSLKQFLQKKDRTIDRRKRLILAMDAAFGMEYLHGKCIVHFDLKCENLLVNMRDPHRPVCKIGDLGLSKVKQKTLVSGGVRGTLPWMAPELLSGKSCMVNEKVDVYSFGIVMWELLTGEEPYAGMHCASVIGGIVNNTLRPETPPWCDPEWRALMESCWSSDPVDRPSFLEISQKLRKMAAAINVK